MKKSSNFTRKPYPKTLFFSTCIFWQQGGGENNHLHYLHRNISPKLRAKRLNFTPCFSHPATGTGQIRIQLHGERRSRYSIQPPRGSKWKLHSRLVRGHLARRSKAGCRLRSERLGLLSENTIRRKCAQRDPEPGTKFH